MKKITRATLRDFGSDYWHCLAGQTVFPVQTAVRYRIPLILWGAHQGLEQVGMYSHEDEVEMTRRHRQGPRPDGPRSRRPADDVRHAEASPTSGSTATRTMRRCPRSACAASTSATTCAGIRRPSTNR
ncbi:MAG: hypothetical protein V9G29_03365 [Burkholderiaceae bacterium]